MKLKLLIISIVYVMGFTSHSQNGISSFTAPSQAALNTNASVTINYNADVEGQYQFQVFPKNPDNSINFGAGGTSIFAGGILPAAPTGGVFTSSPTDLYVAPNFMLGDYIWFIKITVGGVDYFTASNQLVSIVATLSTNSFSIDSNELFINHKLKSLEINNIKLGSKSASIYDITGKKALDSIKLNDNTSVDISNLQTGVYVLVTNDNRRLKFVL